MERNVVFEARDQAHQRRKHELAEGVVDSLDSIEGRICIRGHAFSGITDRGSVHAVQVETEPTPTITGLVQRHIAEREDGLEVVNVRAGARRRPLGNCRKPISHQTGVIDATRRSGEQEGKKRQIKQRFHRSVMVSQVTKI
jgi:hypothetical protein